MHETSLGLLRPLTWHDLAMVLGILVATQLLVLATRRIVRRTAERAPSHRRLLILRASPIARLAIGIAGIVLVVPHPGRTQFRGGRRPCRGGRASRSPSRSRTMSAA